MSKTIVKLRVFKGAKILLEADGKTPANENELITLTYNDLQWKKHLSNLGKMGVCKIELEKVYVDEKEVEISKEIKEEVEAVLKPATTTLTPEQKTIQQLTERLAKLEAKEQSSDADKNANNVKVNEVKIVTGLAEGETLEELQAKYVEKFQKELPKPFKNNVAWIKTQLEA